MKSKTPQLIKKRSTPLQKQAKGSILASQQAKRLGRVLKRPKTEHADQVRLVMHLRTFYPTLVVAGVPNGAAVSPAQRLRLVAEGLLAGFPDLMICEPRGKFHGLFIEMKALDKPAPVSAVQKRVHEKLLAKGYAVFVAYGYNDALAITLEYLGEDQ